MLVATFLPHTHTHYTQLLLNVAYDDFFSFSFSLPDNALRLVFALKTGLLQLAAQRNITWIN